MENDYSTNSIGVWLPTVETGTGTDVFTKRLLTALKKRGVRAEITWLPHRAEYLPWTVEIPKPPTWASVVHVNTWLHQRFLPPALPVVATFHSVPQDAQMARYRSPLQRLYHKHWVHALERRSAQSATCITAVSQYVSSHASRLYKTKGVTTVYNWVDLETFRPKPKSEDSIKRLLYIGTPNVRKGIDLLPHIMRSLGEEYQLTCTVPLEKIPGYPNLPNNILSICAISGDHKLAVQYNNCDIFLFPTRSEGFGLVALEAQACGIPVVASNAPPLPEVIRDGESGILCPVDDVASFVTAIKRITTDHELYDQMRAAARKQAENFSEDSAISLYMELYEKAARTKAHPV